MRRMGRGGQTYRWRDDAPIDACGTVQLGRLPGGTESCVFYLYTELPAQVTGPTELSLSSDDDTYVWLDGQRVHAFWGNRGVDVDNTDTAYVAPAHGGKLLVKVA